MIFLAAISHLYISHCFVIVLLMIPFVCGIIFIAFHKRGIKSRKKTAIVYGMALSVIGFVIAFPLYPLITKALYGPFRLELCSDRISVVGESLIKYAKDHDNILPSKENWYDLLIDGSYTTKNMFLCSGMGVQPGETSYAFNESLGSINIDEINPETVLLFEIKGSKNAAGSSSSVTFDNHRQKATFFLINGEVRQISPQKAAKLRWDP